MIVYKGYKKIIILGIFFLVSVESYSQPSPPSLLSPGTNIAPGIYSSDLTPTFEWNSSTGATSYGLYISKKNIAGLYELVFDSESDYGSITGTSFTLPEAKRLESGQEYRWNMRARNASSWSSFSGRLYFHTILTELPDAPGLIFPGTNSEPGTYISDLSPTFEWNSSAGATSYGLYISKKNIAGQYDLVFDSESDYGNIIGTSFTLPDVKRLESGQEYRWNMRARNASGWSNFSNRLYFNTISSQTPDTPELLSPGTQFSPGITISELTPIFQWKASIGATGYGLYVSKRNSIGGYDLIFDSESDYGIITGTSFTLPYSKKLEPGYEYRWNMRAKNESSWSDFSSRYYFNIISSESYIVRLVYLVPSDKTENEKYKIAIEAAIKHVRIWYNNQLKIENSSTSRTFLLNDPIVEVIKTHHTSEWYSVNPNGNEKYWWWNNVRDDAQYYTGSDFNNPIFTWVFYIDSDNIFDKQIGGAGMKSICILPAADMEGLINEDNYPPIEFSCRWVGGLGHELGHAFGIPHPPGCDEGMPSCDANSIMWVEYINYPDTYFSESEKNILLSSPFFYNELPLLDLPGCSDLVNVRKDNDVFLSFHLSQNYPNPFNPNTKIIFSIPQTSFVTLKVYDILGKEISTLVNDEKPLGIYEIEFDGSNLSSGTYFYKITVGDYSDTKKFLLLK